MSKHTIDCPEHGEIHAAYICRHLHDQPVQSWHGAYPDDEDRWPDAWCAKCEEAFQREGEWNERNEDIDAITMICCDCHLDLRGASVGRLQGEAFEHWRAYIDACMEELNRKQDYLEVLTDDFANFAYDQHDATLTFSDPGKPFKRVCRVEFIGTLSSTSNSWRWAWANFHLLEQVRSRIAAVRDVGETRDFPHLTVAQWPADEYDAWEMSAIAAKVLGARAVYRAPGKGGLSFMAILDVWQVAQPH